MSSVAPIIESCAQPYASHFFSKPEKKLRFVVQSNRVSFQVDPTKIIPQPAIKSNGIRRLELSVVLHTGCNDVRWQDGANIFTVSHLAYGSVEFMYNAGESMGLFIEPEESRVSKFHANVLGWDESDEDMQQAQAIELAANAYYAINPQTQKHFLDFQEKKLLEYHAKRSFTIVVSALPES